MLDMTGVRLIGICVNLDQPTIAKTRKGISEFVDITPAQHRHS